MTNWAWKVIISTGPWSIIFPIANWRRGKTSKTKWLQACSSDKTRGTYVNVVDVQDLRVELQPHGLGLLDWVCHLAVRLHTNTHTHIIRAPESQREADVPLHNTSPSTRPAPPGSLPSRGKDNSSVNTGSGGLRMNSDYDSTILGQRQWPTSPQVCWG